MKPLIRKLPGAWFCIGKSLSTGRKIQGRGATAEAAFSNYYRQRAYFAKRARLKTCGCGAAAREGRSHPRGRWNHNAG